MKSSLSIVFPKSGSGYFSCSSQSFSMASQSLESKRISWTGVFSIAFHLLLYKLGLPFADTPANPSRETNQEKCNTETPKRSPFQKFFYFLFKVTNISTRCRLSYAIPICKHHCADFCTVLHVDVQHIDRPRFPLAQFLS